MPLLITFELTPCFKFIENHMSRGFYQLLEGTPGQLLQRVALSA
jgi:hypothetical protein